MTEDRLEEGWASLEEWEGDFRYESLVRFIDAAI